MVFRPRPSLTWRSAWQPKSEDRHIFYADIFFLVFGLFFARILRSREGGACACVAQKKSEREGHFIYTFLGVSALSLFFGLWRAFQFPLLFTSFARCSTVRAARRFAWRRTIFEQRYTRSLLENSLLSAIKLELRYTRDVQRPGAKRRPAKCRVMPRSRYALAGSQDGSRIFVHSNPRRAGRLSFFFLGIQAQKIQASHIFPPAFFARF